MQEKEYWVVIEPDETVRIVEAFEDAEYMRDLVKGYVEIVPRLGNSQYQLICNEDAKALKLKKNRLASFIGNQKLLGPVIVTKPRVNKYQEYSLGGVSMVVAQHLARHVKNVGQYAKK